LFGTLVPQGRTVFLDPSRGLNPFADQWRFLVDVERVGENQLDEIIEINELGQFHDCAEKMPLERPPKPASTFGLPPCAQRMLAEGVRDYQRVTCFRLGVHLRRVGLPRVAAAALLHDWATRNRPRAGKRVITAAEVTAQLDCAYNGSYRSYGCEDPAMQPFCARDCPVRARPQRVSVDLTVPLENQEPERRPTMSETSNNRPVKTFWVRGLQVAIWEHEVERESERFVRQSVTLNKRYRDPKTGAWTDSSTFFPDDLPRLRLLLDKAYEHIMLRDDDARREAAEASEVDAAVA